MITEEIVKKIESVRLCMMAHPDNTEGSEFADRINDLTEILPALSLDPVSGTGAVCEKTSLKILEWLKSDNCWITDKEGNKLPDAIICGKDLKM